MEIELFFVAQNVSDFDSSKLFSAYEEAREEVDFQNELALENGEEAGYTLFTIEAVLKPETAKLSD